MKPVPTADINSSHASMVLGPAVEENQWSGMHQSLDGLGSMIANLANMGTVEAPVPVETFHAGDSAAGGRYCATQEKTATEQAPYAGLPKAFRDHPHTVHGPAIETKHRLNEALNMQEFSVAVGTASLSPSPYAASAFPKEPLHAERRASATAVHQQDDSGDSDASLDFSQHSGDSNSNRNRTIARHAGQVRSKRNKGSATPIEPPNWLLGERSVPHSNVEDPAFFADDRRSSPTRKASVTLTPLPVERGPQAVQVVTENMREIHLGDPRISTPVGAYSPVIHESTPLNAPQDEDEPETPRGGPGIVGVVDTAESAGGRTPARALSSTPVPDVTGGAPTRFPFGADAEGILSPRASATAGVVSPRLSISPEEDRQDASSVESSASSDDATDEEVEASPGAPMITRTTRVEETIVGGTNLSFGSVNESYVELDISRNDPSLAGLHGMASVRPGIGSQLDLPSHGSADLPSFGSDDADIETRREEDERHRDVSRLIEELSESSSETSSGESDDGEDRDEALLAGLGFADAAQDGIPDDDDEGDWV